MTGEQVSVPDAGDAPCGAGGLATALASHARNAARLASVAGNRLRLRASHQEPKFASIGAAVVLTFFGAGEFQGAREFFGGRFGGEVDLLVLEAGNGGTSAPIIVIIPGKPVWLTRSVFEARGRNVNGPQKGEAVQIRMPNLVHRDPEPVLEPLRDDVAMAPHAKIIPWCGTDVMS
jgi:hypothetical protein